MKRNEWLLSIVTSLLFAAPACAAAKGDADFVTKAAQGGMEEVELGRMAQNQAASADVKRFGERMVTDHGKAGDDLKAAAQKSGMEIPAELSKKQQSDKARLAKLNGAAFDKEYMKMMVADHKEDVAEFEKEASSGTDANIKDFASKTLPTLKEHLQMAQQTEKSIAANP